MVAMDAAVEDEATTIGGTGFFWPSDCELDLPPPTGIDTVWTCNTAHI